MIGQIGLACQLRFDGRSGTEVGQRQFVPVTYRTHRTQDPKDRQRSVLWSPDPVEAHVGLQRCRDRDRAIFLLTVLENRDQGPADGET